MLLSRLAAEILALEFASGSASALFALQPRIFEVLMALLDLDATPLLVRRTLASMALFFGAVALGLLTYALGGRHA